MVCVEGFNFGPLSAPRAKKRDADVREFGFLEPCLLRCHPLVQRRYCWPAEMVSLYLVLDFSPSDTSLR